MIRILAHYDEKTGSHYHRVHLPITHLKRHYPEFHIESKKEMKESDFANCDILFYNRFIKMNVFNLNQLRKKYGFKIVIDMDDKVHIPKNHYMYNFYEKEKIPDKIIANLINADYIICSTEYLANDLKEYNKNIIVIPNSIDFETEQYQYKERELSNKLRIVYPCSLSHVHDVKLFEQSFKRIKNDSYLKNKVQFTLGGYNTTNAQTKRIWDEMTKIYKLVGSYKLAESLPTNEYMAHYDNQDVCTIPLRTTEFEKSKSNLKLLEAGAKKCVVIASNVLPYTNDSGYFLPVNDVMDWYKHIKELVKSTSMREDYSEKLYDYVYNSYNMNNINKLRYELFSTISNTSVDIKNTKIISVCYDNNQITEYERYMNKVRTVAEKSYLFEYNPIVDIVTNNLYNLNTYKYVGIFSWKFPNKTAFSEREVYYNIDDKHDVYVFTRPIFKDGAHYFKYSNDFHKVLFTALETLCAKLGVEFTTEPAHAIYSNFYVARYDILKDYVENYIIPSIVLFETDMREIAWEHSRYQNLSKEDLMKYTGLNYYPMHSFILERMFSIYLHNNQNLKVKFCSGSY